jgi:hypothetical protein
MASPPHRLPPDRAKEVETQLRARAEQLKPTERPTSRATPLGLCRTCDRIVYAGERFVKPSIYVFHADCVSGTGAA